ncbi:MAG: MarR family transcriptional regulator [Naasia sp.]|nr:MarR family transcriptional regulator [Naasia sp.]
MLEAFRAYRVAESAMRRRTREAMAMGENDLLALRFVLRARNQGRAVGPKDLARHLDISSASTTVLLDRLEKRGHLRRERSTADRRALVVVPTMSSDAEIRANLGEVHTRMMSAAGRLSPDDAEVVIQFLESMRDAVDADANSGQVSADRKSPAQSSGAPV